MSYVIFAGSRLIPAPRINLTKTYIYSQDNDRIGATWNVELLGLFLPDMGSPTSSTIIGTGSNDPYFWDQSDYPSGEALTSDNQNLGRIIRKQEHIRQLFANNPNGLIEIQSADGSQAMKFILRVNDITFPANDPISWFNKCDYTITGQTEQIYGVNDPEDSFDSYISSADESWSIEVLDEPEGVNFPRTYRLNHNISATGRRIYDEAGTLLQSPWKNARDFVISRMGMDSSYLTSSGVKDLPSYYTGFNHTTSENIGELNGEYSITESWLLCSGSALEDFSVSTQNSLQDGLTNVSINGTITGLELRDANQNVLSYKIDNAEDKFSAISGIIYSRAQTYSNTSLNMVPVSTTIGKNPITGIINYDYQYNNRPTNFVSGARSESIEIIDDFGGSIVAAISVPYRTNGPVLQDIGTKKESTRTLSVELILGPQSSLDVPTSINSDVSSLISQASPQGVYQSFLVDNTQSWNPKEGRLSITKTWLYEA